MSWAKKINQLTLEVRKKLSMRPNTNLTDDFSGEEGKKRIHTTLSQNPAVDNDQKIIDHFISEGKSLQFRRGDNLIEQGGAGEDVYFLLSGEVDVIVNRKKIAIREAPNQVGEMAAMEPGKVRTATVKARSKDVVTLKVSGDVFRKIWTSHHKFKERLQREMAFRHRERIVATKIATENCSPVWFVLSLGTGFVAAAITWFVLPSVEWTVTARSIITGSAALTVFLFTLSNNPAFFWRRCFALTLLSMIGTFALNKFISFKTTNGIGSLQLDISSGGEVDGRGIAAFLIVLSICAFMDYKKNSHI